MDSITPKTYEELFARLSDLAIAYENHEHPPVFTVAESQNLRGSLPGAHVKNLFLRDKKKSIWLVTVLEDREVDLKALRKRLGAAKTLSFGSPELLMEVLGVEPGAVTPYGVINDSTGRATVILDQGLFDHSLVNAHPLRNDMTVAVAPNGLIDFLEAQNHAPEIIDFGAPLLPDEGA